jgi:hypothetical protein
MAKKNVILGNGTKAIYLCGIVYILPRLFFQFQKHGPKTARNAIPSVEEEEESTHNERQQSAMMVAFVNVG